jgi:hypothetical protein
VSIKVGPNQVVKRRAIKLSHRIWLATNLNNPKEITTNYVGRD